MKTRLIASFFLALFVSMFMAGCDNSDNPFLRENSPIYGK